MTKEQSEIVRNKSLASIDMLKKNSYPGRGIILGQNSKGLLVQIYWIMGRSANSRNRIFRIEGQDVATEAADPAKLQDPSLIIYYPVRVRGNIHIVTNGDQTDTIMHQVDSYTRSHPGGASSSLAFLSALQSRHYEPDGPNFTPRISGIMDISNPVCAYQLSIVKANLQIEGMSQRNFFLYEQPIAGYGHGISTYRGDGNPLPTFEGEPFMVPLQDTIEETLDFWWDLLDEENRISLLVKFIDPKNGTSQLKIKNKYSN